MKYFASMANVGIVLKLIDCGQYQNSKPSIQKYGFEKLCSESEHPIEWKTWCDRRAW